MKRILMLIVALLLVPTLVKADESIFDDMTDEEKIEELIRIVIDLEQRIEELENGELVEEDEDTDEETDEEIDTSGMSEREMQNALSKAERWANNLNWSRATIQRNLVDMEGFPEDVAEWAAENVQADFNEAALATAESWSKNLAWSNSTIRRNLVDMNEFTEEEADYAIENLD